MCLGKDIVDFILRNKLEEIKCITEFTDGLVWSVFLDDEHYLEIEYTFSYEGDDEVTYRDWTEFKGDFDVELPEKEQITEEEALKRRGLA